VEGPWKATGIKDRQMAGVTKADIRRISNVLDSAPIRHLMMTSLFLVPNSDAVNLHYPDEALLADRGKERE
jgi:hypothetical protein